MRLSGKGWMLMAPVAAHARGERGERDAPRREASSASASSRNSSRVPATARWMEQPAPAAPGPATSMPCSSRSPSAA
jgi:hypothetical protein